MITSSPTLRFTDYRRKWYILHNNSAICHPIFIKLGMNDDMRSINNHLQWRYDDVITGLTVHWLKAKMVHFAQLVGHLSSYLHQTLYEWWCGVTEEPSSMTSSTDLQFTDYRRKWYILDNNSVISHPIFTKLGMNDDERSLFLVGTLQYSNRKRKKTIMKLNSIYTRVKTKKVKAQSNSCLNQFIDIILFRMRLHFSGSLCALSTLNME